MEPLKLWEKLRILAGRYRHAILVVLIGLALMLLPLGGGAQTDEKPETQAVAPTVQTDLEQRLESILSRVSGAGEVEVLLTERSGQETHYQTDTQTDSEENAASENISTVIVEDADSAEAGLIRRTDPPVYLGAVVVCQGADDPRVKLAIVEAVRCATGLGADQITVVKMK